MHTAERGFPPPFAENQTPNGNWFTRIKVSKCGYPRDGKIMAIKRYIASADTTITNAYEENLTTRASQTNMGAADILETFVIYGQASSTSVELDVEVAQKVLNLIDFIEDLDDVQNVHTNADVSDEVLEQLNQ